MKNKLTFILFYIFLIININKKIFNIIFIDLFNLKIKI